MPEFETAFNHHKFDKLDKDELYLVYKKGDQMEKAIVPPSLAWLETVFTYAPPGDIILVEKVKIVKRYEPKK